MTNIIFLDVDEVLNSASSNIYCKQLGLASYQFQGFSPISVALIRELCTLAEAKIVLSSTWRMHYKSDEECINDWEAQMEKLYKWPEFPIIGRTPNGWRDIETAKWSCRGEEIKQWLDLHHWTQYVIIDDSTDMLKSQKDHFIHVDYRVGFNFLNFQRALEIFNVDSKFKFREMIWRKRNPNK